MAESLSIRNIIDRISSGEIRIPAFQRGFVWEPSQVAFLLDSIYKGYPIGTIFLWTTSERLKSERNLGQFKLDEPRKDYPINYVLDGQQRITSLFSVFQTSLVPSVNLEDIDWRDIYYDVNAGESLQESSFYALRPEEVDNNRHFPMNVMYDSGKYRRATEFFINDTNKIAKIDGVQEKFKEALIFVQSLPTDDRDKVAIVFERINRAGTELDIYQLLVAWSWSEEFDLRKKFEDLAEEISSFGFGDIVDDQDLQLKCCSGIILGEADSSSILRLRGEDVRDKFIEIENGIKGAIDFLKTELKIPSLHVMPYPAMLVSLSCFFATKNDSGFGISDNQRRQILKWFWQSLFSRRYSAAINVHHKSDIDEFAKLRENPDYKVKKIEANIEADFFKKNQFNIKNVNTKTFILLLSQNNPKSFLSGTYVILSEVLKRVNRNEFHHIFPIKYLEREGFRKEEINRLANFCFLNNADNQKIKDKSPSDYAKLIPTTTLQDVMESALCPVNALDLDYNGFIDSRVKILIEKAKELTKEL